MTLFLSDSYDVHFAFQSGVSHTFVRILLIQLLFTKFYFFAAEKKNIEFDKQKHDERM